MKTMFEEPSFEVVRFKNDLIVTSTCGCNVGGYDFGPGENESCSGANVSCSCDPNYDDPSANCV